MTTTTPEPKPFRWGWIGLPLVLVAVLSYFMVFAKFPATRDFPWVNLPLALIGLLVSFLSFRRALNGSVRWRKVVHSQLFVFSAVLTGLFLSYIFYLSYQVPSITAVTESLEKPEVFTLTDDQGNPVNLTDFKGKNLIVNFYRGHW